MIEIVTQVKSTFKAATSEVKKVFRECEEAKASGSLAGMSVTASKQCGPIVSSFKKAEAVCKTIFASMEKL